MIEILHECINQRLLLKFEYKSKIRIVEPHLIGVNKAGNTVLSAYQLTGGSGIAWRSFILSEISSPISLAETFVIRTGYNPNDTNMINIINRI